MLGAAFTTAAAWRRMSATALTRSRSTWSMMAMSPGLSLLVRFFVLRSTRAGPAMPGRSSGLVRYFIESLRNWAIIVTILPDLQRTRSHTPHQRRPFRQVAAAAGRPLAPGAGACPLRPGLLRGRPFRGRRGQQLPRVRPPKLGVLKTGQHPGELDDPARVVEAGEAAAGDRAIVGPLDHQVGVGERGHL